MTAPPSRLGFDAALVLVLVSAGAFQILLCDALGATPGAATGLAILLVKDLL